MISYLEGEVIHIKARTVTVFANGVGWRVFAGPNTVAKLKPNKKASLFIHFYVREDAQELYGFLSGEELSLFELLIAVNGVGPRSGQLIVDTLEAKTIVGAISEGKSEVFTRIPGIGTKISQRIIIDLESKLKLLGLEGSDDFTALVDEDDALEALMALGYRKGDAARALKEVPKKVVGVSKRVEGALKILAKPRG